MKAFFKGFRRWLMILAILMMLVLLITPNMNWIVLNEGRLLWPFIKLDRVPAIASSLSKQQIDRVIRRHPQDFNLKLAAAAFSGMPSPSWFQFKPNSRSPLQLLIDKYPNNPAPYALLLGGNLRIDPEFGRNTMANGPLFDAINGPAPTGPARIRLLQLERLAEKGEKLDPDNGLWTVFRAAILYNLHQDSKANKVFIQLSNKKFWNTYQSEADLSVIRLLKLAHGRQSAVAVFATYLGVKFDVGGMLRALARVAVGNAIRLEMKGHLNQCLAIRHAVVYLGGLLRAYSHQLLPALVGPAIASVGALGGHNWGAPPKWLSGVQNVQWRLNHLVTYLRSKGHAQEAKWISKELDADYQITQVTSIALPKNPVVKRTRLLIYSWGSGYLLLKAALILLILAGISFLLSPLTPLKRTEIKRRRSRLVIAGVFLIALIVIGFTYEYWFVTYANQPAFGNSWVISWILWSFPAIAVAWLVIVSIINWRRKAPWLAGAVNGFHRFAIPFACLTLLAYGGVVLGTAKQESSFNRIVKQITRNECRYYEKLAGRTWSHSP